MTSALGGSVPSPFIRIWRVLRGGEASPSRAALSVGIGLFIGCLPLYGLHFALCALACLPFGLDFVLAYLAANISNPLVAPLLIAVEVELGSKVLTGHWIEWNTAFAGWSVVRRFAEQAAIGSVFVGGTLAAIGASVAWAVASRRAPRSESEPELAMRHTVRRYRNAPRGDRIYVSVKLRTDPVASLLGSLGSLGDVVDIGSGRGQLGLFLIEAGRISSLQGFDWDSKKVEIARDAGRELPARFEVLDATDAPISTADTILLIDVLHYLPIEVQRTLVERAARSLRPGGRLIVREADRSAGWRARLTILAEKVGRALGVNRAAQFAFASAADLVAMLERAGLRTEVAPGAQGTPLANVLLIGKKD